MLIFGIAAVTIAGDLGLNLAPVLASAGVLGLAIGFGAQSLVRDFLSGIFMLLEDQYGVGDVIDAGDATGTVEAVSLRVTRLRDVNGVVWHVRNGTINRIGNESQGWARAVVDFPVAYDQDLPEVRQTMKDTADQMWQEPRWHDVIMEEPEVWGVESVSSDAIVMRLVARTLPLRQWEVARELRERLKNALASAAVDGEPVATAIGAGPRPRPAPRPTRPAPRRIEEGTPARKSTSGAPCPAALADDPPEPGTTLEHAMDDTRELSFYEAVGGEETFRRLTRLFYEGVAGDPALRAVYPSKDLGPAEEHLRLFLIQYWGGPATYNELRGHPRLRMRHRHFVIGEAERDAWLRHMRAALDQIGLEPALDAQLWDYLVMAANSLINAPTGPGRPDLGLSPA